MTFKRTKGLKRGGSLSPYSKRRWAEVTAAGFRPTSTFAPRPREPFTAKAKVQRHTGPVRPVLQVVNERAGELCEFPGCCDRWTDTHHRLNRKNGGRHGEAKERINGAAWLLKACRSHHRLVTSAFGAELKRFKDMGWVLMEHQDALRVPVLTRHDEEPVWLLPDGSFLLFEEACA